MVIITQIQEIINFSQLKRISPYVGQVDDLDVFAIIGFDKLSNDDDLDSDGAVQLGIYDTENECSDVYDKLTAAIRAGNKVFVMPESEYDKS